MPKWAIALIIAGPLLVIAIATVIIIHAATPAARSEVASASTAIAAPVIAPPRPTTIPAIVAQGTRDPEIARLNAENEQLSAEAAIAAKLANANASELAGLKAENDTLRAALAVARQSVATTLPAEATKAQQTSVPLTIDDVNAFAKLFVVALENQQTSDAQFVHRVSRKDDIQTALESIQRVNIPVTTQATRLAETTRSAVEVALKKLLAAQNQADAQPVMKALAARGFSPFSARRC